MTIVGELTAGTTDKKASPTTCGTCGATDQKLTPAGHCWDPRDCAKRRIARVSGGGQNLRHPCVVKLHRLGATYWLREFGPKIVPPPNPLPKGFTLDDYSDKGRVYYEAIMENGQATSFQPQRALELAKIFNGTAMNR